MSEEHPITDREESLMRLELRSTLRRFDRWTLRTFNPLPVPPARPGS